MPEACERHGVLIFFGITKNGQEGQNECNFGRVEDKNMCVHVEATPISIK